MRVLGTCIYQKFFVPLPRILKLSSEIWILPVRPQDRYGATTGQLRGNHASHHTLYILCIYPVNHSMTQSNVNKLIRHTGRRGRIHPVLYKAFLRLHDAYGAEIVHRRKRASDMCIEITFDHQVVNDVTGRINSLPEAEACGFWIICRPQTKKGHQYYHGKRVFQLFLSPVHPKKRRETLPNITSLVAAAQPVSAMQNRA